MMEAARGDRGGGCLGRGWCLPQGSRQLTVLWLHRGLGTGDTIQIRGTYVVGEGGGPLIVWLAYGVCGLLGVVIDHCLYLHSLCGGQGS
jgi:hypothetical protein